MRQKIELGNLNLTRRQEGRLSSLHGGKVLSFETRGKAAFVYVNSDLTAEETERLKESMQGLSDEPLPNEVKRQDFLKSPLKKLTPEQIDSYVDDKVKNIEDVKTEMKKLLRLVNYLAGKIG